MEVSSDILSVKILLEENIVMKKRFFVILLTCVLAGSLVGCSFSDGVKDGMKDAQKQESTGDSQK